MQTAFQKIKQIMVMALIFSLLIASVCVPVSAEDESLQVRTLSGNLTDGTVRVFLSSMGNPTQLDLTVDGSYSLNGTSATSISRGSKLTVKFSKSTGKLTLTRGGSTQDMGDGFRLYRHQTTGNNGIKIDQAETSNLYPGDLEFVVKKTSSGYKLYTIVHVFIEDYLYGVLPYEMGGSAPLEALKAQCISARTYAVRAMNGASSNIYDVVDTTNDQVYRGLPTGSERCKQAVDETRGIISMYGNAFAGTYYTASNGGQIDSISNIWGSANHDYIRVKDDPYDLRNNVAQVRTVNVNASGSQSNQTLRSLLENKAKARFNATEVTITAVHSVLPHTPRYPIHSRLYTKLDFEVTANCDGVTQNGTLTFDIFSELESRLTMSINGDNNELWSVKPTATGFAIQARRFGHGTGLSQRGAMKMGEEGYTYDEILAFYFEGCTLKGQTFVKSIRAELSAGGAEVVTQVAPAATGSSAAYAIVEMSGADELLALRTAPNAGADVIMGIPHSAVVRVHSVSGEFALITFGETSGYAHTGAMKISGRPDGTARTIATLESYGTVNNDDYLNLRAGAGTSHTVLAEIPTGTVLPLFDINNGWAYTQYGRESGYVSMDYITRSESYRGDAHDGDATGAEVIAVGGVAMRATPSSTGYSPMTLPEGVIVKVKSDDGSWSEVYYAGVTGFVPSIMLRANGITVEEIVDKPGSGERYAQVSSKNTSLNFRQAASMSSLTMMEIPRNETVIVTKVQGDWCAVRYRGMNGYCAKEYLTLDVSGEQDPSVETQTARVTTEQGSLNMRKSASKNAAIIKTIPRNTVITVLERGKTWSKVTYGGKTGYVMNEFLTFGESEALPDTPIVTPPASGTEYKKAKVVTRRAR
ncbi:MAG: SpoIID/LytB domain-containing protein [Clostridia bacterium]|nr:SpoIID/LytB domain-containing protein [Clostridia bacterium]